MIPACSSATIPLEVGGAVGVIRDEHGGIPRWDELLKCKCDIDATLQELLDHRLVWNEARFCFVQNRDKNLGGNSLFRSAERITTEKRHLKRKWKAHIRFEDYKSQEPTRHDGKAWRFPEIHPTDPATGGEMPTILARIARSGDPRAVGVSPGTDQISTNTRDARSSDVGTEFGFPP